MNFISYFTLFVVYQNLLKPLQNGDNRNIADVKPKVIDESVEKSKIWKLAEINEPSQCCSLRLPDNLLAVKVRISCAFLSHTIIHL